MNRNTITAFLLILATIFFFQSNAWFSIYEAIFNKPHPTKVMREQMKKRPVPADTSSAADNQNSISKSPADTMVPIQEKQRNREADTTERVAMEREEPDSIQPYDTVWVETDKFICAISELGGRIISIRMKEFRYSRPNGSKENGDMPLVELLPQDRRGLCLLEVDGKSLDSSHFEHKSLSDTVVVKEGEERPLLFMHESGLTKEFTFTNGTYGIGYRIEGERLSGRKLMSGMDGITESEEKILEGQKYIQPRICHIYNGEKVEHIEVKKPGSTERTGSYHWVSLTSKYFVLAMIADSLLSGEVRIESKKEDEKKRAVNYRVSWKPDMGQPVYHYTVLASPSKISVLKSHDIGLQKVLFKGYWWFFGADIWFPPLCEFVLWLLNALEGIFGDYGVAIIMITIISRVVIFPLSQSSMKSMSKMKELQPKINKLRDRYKNDPRKQNEELMALYKREGVNPVNPGCIVPMLVQLPIMISLFIVLRKSIELRGAESFLLPWINDLSQPEVIFSVKKILPGFIRGFYGNNFAALPVVMGILTYFQNKMTIKDPSQKTMVYVMPVFMAVIFNNFPSGLVLYWTFGSALQILQQHVSEKFKKKK